jgi:hypothetical protein
MSVNCRLDGAGDVPENLQWQKYGRNHCEHQNCFLVVFFKYVYALFRLLAEELCPCSLMPST